MRRICVDVEVDVRPEEGVEFYPKSRRPDGGRLMFWRLVLRPLGGAEVRLPFEFGTAEAAWREAAGFGRLWSLAR